MKKQEKSIQKLSKKIKKIKNKPHSAASRLYKIISFTEVRMRFPKNKKIEKIKKQIEKTKIITKKMEKYTSQKIMKI